MTQTDNTLNPLPPGILPVGVERKDASVVTDGVNPALMLFLTKLGLVSLHLFDLPVIVTSAKDGAHASGSKHYRGDAVDVRISDKSPLDQSAFLLVLTTLARQFKLAVFDESNLPGASHVHIEIAG